MVLEFPRSAGTPGAHLHSESRGSWGPWASSVWKKAAMVAVEVWEETERRYHA